MTAYAIDPQTRDMSIGADGQVVETETVVPFLLLAIGVKRGCFHGDAEQGSSIHEATQGEPKIDPATFIVQAADVALSRLVDQSVITVQSIDYDAPNLLMDVLELSSTLIVNV